RENYVSVVASQEMNEALERQDAAALFAASGHESTLTVHRASFDSAFAREATNLTLPGEGALVREVDALYRDYVRTVDRVLSSTLSVRLEGYFNELLPRFRALKEKITAIRLLNQANMEWADGEARRIARRT